MFFPLWVITVVHPNRGLVPFIFGRELSTAPVYGSASEGVRAENNLTFLHLLLHCGISYRSCSSLTFVVLAELLNRQTVGENISDYLHNNFMVIFVFVRLINLLTFCLRDETMSSSLEQ